MKTRKVTASIVAGLAAAAVTLGACSSGSGNDDDDLGTAPVTGANPVGGSSSVTVTPSSPSDGGSTGASGGTFAERAGIPTARYTDAGAEIDVPDQSGNGRTVRLGEVLLSRGPGHVAIFTSSGQLLGSTQVTQGSSPSTVSLSTRVPASGELRAVLFTDDGDGRFDIAKDRAVNDGDTDPDDRLELEGEDFDYALR